MLRFPLIAPLMAGGAVVVGALAAGALLGVAFQEPLRRAAKSAAKNAMRSSEFLRDGWETIRDEIDDACAETDWEREERLKKSAAYAAPADGNGTTI